MRLITSDIRYVQSSEMTETVKTSQSTRTGSLLYV